MRKPLIIALFLLLVAFAWADVYPIGTLGTSTSSVYGPFTGLWDYSWTKTIVTATEMTAAGYNGTDNITGVGYHIGNSPSNYTMLGLHMFIRHTTLSSYTDLTDETGIAMPDSAAFTQVFSGDLTFNGGGWYYISFNLGSFDWDGTSNIEIFWKNWDGTYVSGYPNWTYASTGTDYKVVYKNQDNSFPTSNGARYTNRTNLAIVTPATTPPNPAMLVYPTNAGWTFLNGVLSWSPTGGGITDGYDVYLDTVDGSTLVSDNQTGTSYTPTLSPGTTYYWKVVPYNAAGPAANCPVWSFRTPTATQLAESFENTTFPPAGWTNPGSWNRSTTSPFHGAACAYKYASSTPVILSTPLLAIDGSSTLDFWYRSAATTGIGQIKVLYSTDRQNWTQVGTTIAMPTNTTWNNTSVALGTIPAGNYYLAFEASSSTTSSTSVYIDHVFGPEAAALPPEPASLVYPLDNGWTFLDGTLSWTASMNGGLPSSYDVYLGTSNPPSFVANQTGTSYAPTLAAGTTYYWQIVPRNDTGTAANCPVWSFKTPTDTQLAESFDATTFPPVGWVNPNSWSRSTTTPYYGAGCAYKSASTTAAILSTPLLAIDANSVLDFFYRTGSTTGYGLLNVKYSTDRQNWNQIGATIAMPTTTTWNNASVALGTIPAGNYYLAFEVSTSTSTASIYIDHVFGPEAATVVPDPVTLTAPADAAVDVVLKPTFTWTAATIGGIPTGYKVYCDTNANPVTQIADVSTTTYTATTALAYSTTYYWKVVAYNANGNSADSEIRSFTTMADPTIYTFPWLEDFGTTGTNFPPMNWTRWSGLLTQDPVTLTSASGYWVQDDFANIVTSPTNKSARINIYGATTIRHWLMTPPIQMPGTGYQLEFDIALTDYNYAEPITSDPNGTTGVDDRFVVLISDGNSWSTANAVKIWDNDDQTSGGIYEVYNDVPHTGAHYILPLDNYTGIQYIAFYGESTASNADNDFFVDNVLIRETPVAAVFTIAPAITSWDFGMVPVGGSAEKEFAVTNTGPGNLIVSSITQTGTNPPFSIVPTPALPWSLTSADPANTFKVVFTPQTAGGPFTTDVTVTYNNGAQATYTISFTGSAYLPATLPLTEGWENGQGNWIIVNGTQTNKWHIGAGDATYGPYEGNNFAYISNDEGTTVAYTTNSASVTHIYTDIAFDEDCMEFPLSFQWRCRGEGTAWDRMRVYLVDTSVTPVAGAELTTGQVGLANYNLQTAWTAATITLPGSLSGTLKRLVFSWRNDSSSGSQPPANIDNISLTAVPNPTGPVVAPNLDYPADRQTDLPKNGFSFQFSWNMAGSEPDTYNLYLANVADLDPGYTSD
ncbi:MAG TPA: choice-of-anchor J domain-containing protein, partial [Candidatus Cloacimonadota bacterium]|nr:choice-of-anchor J domain-containing protein [Candidatus Cloacimonadota bacterium]